MKEKNEVEQIFSAFYKMVETQFQTKISILRTDNGTEYFNKILGNFLTEKGILHQSTCPDTPEQNGVAERKNRHLLETARAMMFYMQIPKYLWGDAILTASYLINRMPTKILNYITPLQSFKKFFPDSRIHSDLPLKIFGCTAYVHISKRCRSKLDPRAEKCVFLGYPPNKKGYKCFNPFTKRVYITMDVLFVENIPYFSQNLIQGENLVESNFWETIEPLPKTFDTDIKEINPIIVKSEIGLSDEEMLRLIKNRNNLELVVYSRKNVAERVRDHVIIPVPSQLPALDNGSSNIPGNSSSSIPILNSNSDPKPTPELAPGNLEVDNLTIALRK